MHQEIDKIRDKNPERIFYKKAQKIPRHQQNLIDKLHTDTGFDVICSCCLQYKCLEYCKPTTVLTHQEKRKFLVSKCALLENRSKTQHVCNICHKDIKKDRIPKRSSKSKFRFANFPDYLIKKLKKTCQLTQRKNLFCVLICVFVSLIL